MLDYTSDAYLTIRNLDHRASVAQATGTPAEYAAALVALADAYRAVGDTDTAHAIDALAREA